MAFCCLLSKTTQKENGWTESSRNKHWLPNDCGRLTLQWALQSKGRTYSLTSGFCLFFSNLIFFQRNHEGNWTQKINDVLNWDYFMMQDHSLLARRETESRESPIDSEEALRPLFQSTVCANDWDKPLRGPPGWLSGPSGCPFSILFSSAPLVRSQLRARLCQQVEQQQWAHFHYWQTTVPHSSVPSIWYLRCILLSIGVHQGRGRDSGLTQDLENQQGMEGQPRKSMVGSFPWTGRMVMQIRARDTVVARMQPSGQGVKAGCLFSPARHLLPLSIIQNAMAGRGPGTQARSFIVWTAFCLCQL